MKIRQADEVQAVVVSPPPQPWDIDCSKDEIITSQADADDCDVNKIIARCVKYNVPLPSQSVAQMVYADVSDRPTYEQAQQIIITANEAFMQLPPELRFKFNNSPGDLLAFISDPVNRDAAVDLGLFEKPKDSSVTASAVAAPAASAPVAPVTTK